MKKAHLKIVLVTIFAALLSGCTWLNTETEGGISRGKLIVGMMAVGAGIAGIVHSDSDSGDTILPIRPTMEMEDDPMTPDGMMQPPPSLAQGCTGCGGSANARQVDYVPGTSLDTFPVTGETLNLAVAASVRADALTISTLIPAALSDGNSANGEIPRLNVDAYTDATQTNLAVVFEMEYGALGLWMVDPGTFFLGGQTDYTGDFASNTFFDHFGIETDAANIPTGTADFNGVINAISHTGGRPETGAPLPSPNPLPSDYLPESVIFVASELITMRADFDTNALTSPDITLRFDRQYYDPGGTGGAEEVFRMLATDPGALLAGNAYSTDIGSSFRATSGNLGGNPSSWTFNGEPNPADPASGNGIISGTNDWRLGITRTNPASTCCHGPGTGLTINGKFYGPNAEEAIGVGRVDTNGNGGEFIVGIFARQREE